MYKKKSMYNEKNFIWYLMYLTKKNDCEEIQC